MKLDELQMEAAWRTATVTQLCLAMRESQDWSAMPILADAIQDAGCPEDSELLAELRNRGHGYAVSAGLVGVVLSAETAEAVRALCRLHATYDCPYYETLVSAATGNHGENRDGDGGSSWDDGEYLHFNATDAHGPIPAGFWDLVQMATGKPIPKGDRATRFSCSC